MKYVLAPAYKYIVTAWQGQMLFTVNIICMEWPPVPPDFMMLTSRPYPWW
jgi:hypothetical protein